MNNAANCEEKPFPTIIIYDRKLVPQPRYYAIPTSIASQLMTAQKVVLTVNRFHRLNTELIVNNKMLADIHKAYSLHYANFNDFYNPKDTAVEKNLVKQK